MERKELKKRNPSPYTISIPVLLIQRSVCLSVCLSVRPDRIFFLTERAFDMRFFAKVSLMMRFCNVSGLDFIDFVEIFRNDFIATWLAEILRENAKKCKKSKNWRPKTPPIWLNFGMEVGPDPLMTNHLHNRRFQLNCAESVSNNCQKLSLNGDGSTGVSPSMPLSAKVSTEIASKQNHGCKESVPSQEHLNLVWSRVNSWENFQYQNGILPKWTGKLQIFYRTDFDHFPSKTLGII